MSVLQDSRLRELCQIFGAVEPFDPERLQPASIDLTLGSRFRIPSGHKHRYVDLGQGAPPDLTEEITTDEFVLQAGEFALGETFERIYVPETCVGRLEGKSSLGRLGLIVHVTAGFFDPGFEGKGTLEFVNLLRIPIVLRPGVPICQISFQLLMGKPDATYDGRYQGDDSVAPSRWDPHLTQRR
jgi:dCTP deaminase